MNVHPAIPSTAKGFMLLFPPQKLCLVGSFKLLDDIVYSATFIPVLMILVNSQGHSDVERLK